MFLQVEGNNLVMCLSVFLKWYLSKYIFTSIFCFALGIKKKKKFLVRPGHIHFSPVMDFVHKKENRRDLLRSWYTK